MSSSEIITFLAWHEVTKSKTAFIIFAMPIWIIAFFAGNLSLLFFHSLPSQQTVWGFSLGFLTWYFFLPRKCWVYLHYLMMICLGFVWAYQQAYHTLQPPTSLPQTVVLKGIVASIPEDSRTGIHFEFLSPTAGHSRLTWQGVPPPLTVGDKWQLKTHLQPIFTHFNPGGFDYQAWLFEHHIQTLGFVIDSKQNYLLSTKFYIHPIDKWRQQLNNFIALTLAKSPMKGFIAALAVGIRDQITQTQWEILRATGTNHLMAIAGLHIGLISTGIFFLVKNIWPYLGKAALYFPAPIVAAFCALMASLTYSGLAGFSLPTTRAIIMLAVALGSLLYRRHLRADHAFCLALLGILLLTPLAFLSQSFCLSFTAVLLLIYSAYGRLPTFQHWRHLLHTQWVLTLGLLPLSILFFQQWSLIGLIANMIAIPWVGFFVLPCTLLASVTWIISPYVASKLFLAAAIGIKPLWWLLEKLSSFTFFQWIHAMPNEGIFVLTEIGIFLLLSTRLLPGRWLGFFYLLPLLTWQAPSLLSSQVKLMLLDTSSDLITIIQTKNHVLVYKKSVFENSNADENLISALQTEGINKINVLIGNMSKKFSIQQTISSCEPEKNWQWDDVNFQFTNDPSSHECILNISSGKNSLVILDSTSKLSKSFQKKAILQNTILIMPAKNSQNLISHLMNFQNPKYILLAGNKAPYFVCDRCFNTYDLGAISLTFDATTLSSPYGYRLTHSKFWD